MDVASLGLAVDSSQVDKGRLSLDQLSTAAKRAQSAQSALSVASAKAAHAQASAVLAAARASETATKADIQAAAAAKRKAAAALEAARASAAQTAAEQAQAKAATAAAAAMNAEATAATKAGGAVRQNAVVANDNVRRMSGSMSGLAAQFQDIGVTAAAGMSPAIIGLQQGAQIAGQMEMAMQGGASAVGVLGNAFKSLFSPLTFIVIALTTLAAAGLQMVDWPHLAASALNGLADVLSAVAPYAVAAAAALALIYAPAILGGLAVLSEAILGVTARLAGLAIGFALANPATAFVIGITAAVAAANIFRDELAQIFGVDIVGAAKTGVNYIIGSFVASFHDIQFIWKQLPNIIGAAAIGAANAAISAIQKMINAAAGMLDSLIEKVNGALAKLPGGFSIGKIGKVDFGQIDNPYADALGKANEAHYGQIQSDLSRDYLGDFASGIAKGASAASDKLKELAGWMGKVDEKGKKKKGGGGKTEGEKYQDIVDGAQRKLASMKAEQDAVGMSELAAAKLKYETDLLNQAQQKGIHLTAQQRAELIGLADQMAETEVATKKAKEALDFAKDATKGFLSDLRQGLANGEGFWKSFGNAAMNVLDKIVDKLEGEFVDALFSASQAGSGIGGGGGSFIGTILGGIGSLLGFASGGYTGRGAANKAAGVVHGGEYVFSKKATDRIGIGALDQLHRRAKGYAGGGYVQPETPRVYPAGNQNMQPLRIEVVGEEGPMFRPTIKAVSNGQAVKVVDQRAPAHVQQGIERYDKSMPSRISDVMERNG